MCLFTPTTTVLELNRLFFFLHQSFDFFFCVQFVRRCHATVMVQYGFYIDGYLSNDKTTFLVNHRYACILKIKWQFNVP